MQDEILLSIYIPTYNREKYLKESLDLIVSQKSFNKSLVEVIISDNASTDNTDSLIKEYQKRYNNIKHFRNKENLGMIKNLIPNINYINGKYFWLLADDDCIGDSSIKYLLDIIQKGSFDLMFSKVKFMENIGSDLTPVPNTYKSFLGIKECLSYFLNNDKSYQYLINFFSFYSIIIGSTKYLRESLASVDKNVIENNNFPHDLIIYSNLKDKRIIIPDGIYVIGRILNQSYGGSTKLIKDLKENMTLIEKNNDLKGFHQREKIKKICIYGWTKTMLLAKLLKKLKINYKTNTVLKRIYYLYKKYLQ